METDARMPGRFAPVAPDPSQPAATPARAEAPAPLPTLKTPEEMTELQVATLVASGLAFHALIARGFAGTSQEAAAQAFNLGADFALEAARRLT